MSAGPDRLDAAIETAARHLMTPLPDDLMGARLVAGLPGRRSEGRRWQRPAAAAVLAGLGLWLLLGRPPQPEPLAARLAARFNNSLAAVPEGVPRVEPATRALDARSGTRMTILAGPGDDWGLAPMAALAALTVSGLDTGAIAPRDMDVGPLEIAALPMTTALDSMKE